MHHFVQLLEVLSLFGALTLAKSGTAMGGHLDTRRHSHTETHTHAHLYTLTQILALCIFFRFVAD